MECFSGQCSGTCGGIGFVVWHCRILYCGYKKETFGVPAVRVLGGLPGFKYISACLYACHGISTRTFAGALKIISGDTEWDGKSRAAGYCGAADTLSAGIYCTLYNRSLGSCAWYRDTGLAEEKFNRAGAEKEYEALSHLRYSGGRNRYSA